MSDPTPTANNPLLTFAKGHAQAGLVDCAAACADDKSLREQVAELEGWKVKQESSKALPKLMLTFYLPPNLETWQADPWPAFDTSSDAILAVIRRRFKSIHERRRFGVALFKLLDCGGSSVTHDHHFALATATPEQLCRATIAAAGKEQV